MQVNIAYNRGTEYLNWLSTFVKINTRNKWKECFAKNTAHLFPRKSGCIIECRYSFQTFRMRKMPSP